MIKISVDFHCILSFFFISFASTAVAEWEAKCEGKFQETEMRYFSLNESNHYFT